MKIKSDTPYLTRSGHKADYITRTDAGMRFIVRERNHSFEVDAEGNYFNHGVPASRECRLDLVSEFQPATVT